MDKNQFATAFKNIEKYSDAQCKIAEVLIELEKDYEVTASVKYIIEKTNLTLPTVYNALKLFQKDKIILKNKNFQNTYTFNKERVQEIIDYYIKKKKLTV